MYLLSNKRRVKGNLVETCVLLRFENIRIRNVPQKREFLTFTASKVGLRQTIIADQLNKLRKPNLHHFVAEGL